MGSTLYSTQPNSEPSSLSWGWRSISALQLCSSHVYHTIVHNVAQIHTLGIPKWHFVAKYSLILQVVGLGQQG